MNNILLDEQHGFCSGRSNTTCNVTLCNYIFNDVNAHSQDLSNYKIYLFCDLSNYTDFAKDFD